MRKLHELVLFMVVLLIVPRLFAASIILDNDEVVKGKITQYSNNSITVETLKGTLEIPISRIHLINYLGDQKGTQMQEPGTSDFTLFLQNGEIIEGIITQFTNEFLTVESKSGYGTLQIPISSVNFITTGKSHIDLNQRDAIGYVQKNSTLSTPGGSASYSSNQISYKFFLDKNLFGNLLAAYGSTSTNGSKLQILSLDYRMGLIFKEVQNILLYYGGTIGYLQIKDDTNNIDGSGTGYGVFVGAEIFFQSLPNFGFSGEIGYSIKKADEYETSDLSISSFPSFSIHYYF